jgi:geranylgeranyl diphosphate synthase, type II
MWEPHLLDRPTDLPAPGHSDAKSLDEWRSALDRTLSDVLSTLSPGPMRDAIAQALEGGKRIRPLLTMAACAAAGGNYRDALNAAAAIELLHCASLIHDDIMDRSALRRGKPTVHSQHGISAAVLSGDLLIALAYRTLHADSRSRKPDILREFSETFVLLCEGQGEDIRFTDATQEAGKAHTEMVRKKTAELLAGSLSIGARIATEDPATIQTLRTFGLYLGLAYQAKDDLLDAIGTEQQTGKTCGTDKKNGRHTYVSLASPGTDAVSGVDARITEYTDKALLALGELPRTPARQMLGNLAQLLVDRNI